MTDHTPHPVDIHVGARVRLRRKTLGMSQEALAEVSGISFQQVQKYERGGNRISASRLVMIARAQKVPIAYYFEGVEGLEQTADTTAEANAHTFLLSTEGLALSQTFPRIPDPVVRTRLLGLISSLATLD